MLTLLWSTFTDTSSTFPALLENINWVLPALRCVRCVKGRAITGLAWKCAHKWGDHPLTSHRVEGHQSERTTRQATSRSFPLQHEKSSLVSRLVKTWEKLPVHVQGEEKQSVVKNKI
jgi:hypothetical protein